MNKEDTLDCRCEGMPLHYPSKDCFRRLQARVKELEAALGWKEIDRKDYPKNYEKMKHSRFFMEDLVDMLKEENVGLRKVVDAAREEHGPNGLSFDLECPICLALVNLEKTYRGYDAMACVAEWTLNDVVIRIATV